MRYPQFTLKTLTFGGRSWQRSVDREERKALKHEIRSLEARNKALDDALSQYIGGMDLTTLVIDPGDDD